MDVRAWLEQTAETIVRSGKQVRPQLAAAVAAASHHANELGDGLLDLGRAALAGARRGLRQALPADQDSVLREVIDGIGDGLQTTAQAAKLAFEEVAGAAGQFARADVARLSGDFGTLGRLFVDAVGDQVRQVAGMAGARAAALRAHAAATLRRTAPVFEAAIAAAATQPGKAAQEALAAGGAAAQQAAGALFRVLGRHLVRLGVAVAGEARHR